MPSAVCCPDDNELTEFVAGVMPTAQTDRIEAHIDACADCRRLLAELARVLEPRADAVEAWPSAGYLGGRYVPEKILGAGGMSIVYEGHDRRLERRVALKVMLDAPQDLRARLRREARALGMLSHPNVVDVYDVDLSDGGAFLACQYVDGGSLRAWLAEAPRTWRQILDVVIDAARGLEAAHRAGLVHRDVTPNNVLVGTDGRGRVADFGLARLPGSRTADTSPHPGRAGPRLGDVATDVAGTPGYVAPEVRNGHEAGAAADQYGLCVTAFEALYGGLPGTNGGPSHGATVPRAIRRVLDRGLRDDPTLRYASVAGLRRALQRAAHRSTRPRLGWALLAAAAVTAVGWAARADPDGPCERARTGLRARVASPPSIPAVVQSLDAYEERWHAARERACQDADHQRLDTKQLDRRWACLHARRLEFVATVGAMRAHDTTPYNDLRAAENLPAISDCEDDDVLARAYAPAPPAIADQVDHLLGRLAQAKAARDAIGDDAAAAILEPLAAQATRLGYDPLTAQVLLERGFRQRELRQTERARATLYNAAHLATGAQLDSVAARAWIHVMTLEGYDRMDRDAALKILPQVDANLARLGHPDDLMAHRAQALAVIADRSGAWAEAEPHYAEALRLTEKAHGRKSLRYNFQLSNVAVHNARVGRVDLAAEQMDAVRDTFEELLGPHTPALARALTNLAGLEVSRLNFTRAVQLAEEALTIQRRHLPPDDDRIGVLWGTIGQALVFDDRPDEAIPHLLRALEIKGARRPESHPEVIDANYQLALGYAEAERFDDAERALASAMAHLDNPAVTREQRGVVWLERGQLSLDQGRHEDAALACRRAASELASPTDDEWIQQARQCEHEAKGAAARAGK